MEPRIYSQVCRFIFIVLFFSLFSSCSFAVTEGSVPVFNDVPSDHWAASSVDDLVRYGVTQGYPDGTFRGRKKISRYETAMFLSKLAHFRETKAAVNEKIMEELRAEVYKLRYSLDMYKNKPDIKRPVYGSFYSRLRMGNLVSSNAATTTINAPLGPIFDYRLIANMRHDFSDYSFVRLGIDTMDSSISGGRDLAREMLEMETEVNSKSGTGVSITSGPGLVIHREGPNNIFPSEDYKAYLRQGNGFKVYGSPWDIDIAGGYLATGIATNGASTSNDIYGSLGYALKNTFLGDVKMKYSFHSYTENLKANYSTSESMVNVYELIFEPHGKLEYGLAAGVSASQNTPHNVFMNISLVSTDLFRSGSRLKFSASKIGDEFFEYPTHPGLFGLNMFDHLYANGTYDIGLEISQELSRGFLLKMVSDVVTGPSGEYTKDEPKANATFELGLELGIFEGAVMTVGYRVYQVPSAVSNATSDIFGIGFKYIY